MILAFCTKGEGFTAELDDRFGRAAFFTFYDTETKNLTVRENSTKTAAGGAGSLSVQQLLDNGVKTLIAPEAGPQAMDALKAFGIPVHRQGDAKTVAEAIAAWEAGKLAEIERRGTKGLHKA